MLAEALPDARTPHDGRRDLVLLVGAAAIALGALVARTAAILVAPTFYAEDGRYFFADAYNEGWTSVVATTNGYFHVFPRLLANAALSLGVQYRAIPAVFVGACLAIYLTLWIAIAVRIPRSAGVRGLLILATFLVPIGNEIFGNLTNIQWFMVPLAVVLWTGNPPRTPAGRATRAVLFALCLWTGPFAVVLAPVFALDAGDAHEVRERRTLLAIAGGAMLLTLISLARFGTVERLSGPARGTPIEFLELFVRMYSFPLCPAGCPKVSAFFIIVVAVLVLSGLVLLARAVTRSPSRLARLSFWLSIAFFATAVASYWREPSSISSSSAASRVFYLPMLFLLWTLLDLTDMRGVKALAWVVCMACFALQIPQVAWEPTGYGPDPATLWPRYARLLEAGEAVRVPIRPAGWEMVLEARPGGLPER